MKARHLTYSASIYNTLIMFGEFKCIVEEFEDYNSNVITTMRFMAQKEATILGQLGEVRGAMYLTMDIRQFQFGARTSERM